MMVSMGNLDKAYSAPYPYALGITQTVNGIIYQFLKYNDGAGNIPGIQGMVACGDVTTKHTATCDYGTTNSDQAFRGIVRANVVLNGEACWFVIGGEPDIPVWTDTGVAADDYLVPDIIDASADGNIDTMLDGEEEQVFGVAMAADDALTTATMLELGTVTTNFTNDSGVTVTGGTSTATGTLKKLYRDSNAVARGILLTTVTGTFQTAEALTTAGGGSIAAGVDVVYSRLGAGKYRIWRR